MKKLTLLFCLFLSFPWFAQSELEENEEALNVKLLALRTAKTEEEINFLNAEFKKAMESFLKLDGAFRYKFTKLKTVAIIDSPDGKVRIINWNLEYPDLSYSYCAYVMRWDDNKDKLITTELLDNLDAYSSKPEGVIDAKNWYGALYYKIVPFEHSGKQEYLLIGWDGGTTGSNFKIIDVLCFPGGNLRLGSPVFKNKKATAKRVVYEYSDRANMVMRFEEKYNRVVFDHLSPESPALAGVYSYYVPDMSYDAYIYADDAWVLNEDVIAVNPDEGNSKKYYYAQNDKTGKVEKVKMKDDWIDPTNINNKDDIKHVARTPESEAATSVADQVDVEHVKRKRHDRRKPENLSITTGKYRSRKTKRLE